MGMSFGVEVRPEATLLTDRAARFLENGPADVVDLIGHICNLPAAPRIVAEHMAHAMFSGRPEFVLDASGRWSLQASVVTAATVPMARDAMARDAMARDAMARDAMARDAMVREHSPRPYEQARTNRPRRGDRTEALPPAQPLAGLSYVVVDVETTGGQWPADRITEVAAVIVRNGEVVEMFETLVNPQRSIPPFISRLTNISWDMVKDAPTFSDIAPQIIQKLEGNVFVAHNAQFDWKFVSHEVNRASGNRLVGRRICTVRLARQLLPHLSRRSLDHVANYYGVAITGRHRAGGDALATAHCLIRLLDDARERGCTTWQDLEILLGHRKPAKKKRRTALPSPVRGDDIA